MGVDCCWHLKVVTGLDAQGGEICRMEVEEDYCLRGHWLTNQTFQVLQCQYMSFQTVKCLFSSWGDDSVVNMIPEQGEELMIGAPRTNVNAWQETRFPRESCLAR